jgi:hypothetical protein
MILLERDFILQKIFSRINASRPQSISITGDLKIGKTVLLQQILNREIQKNYLDSTKKFSFYYKNLKQYQSGYLELIADIIVSFSKTIKQEKLSGENVYTTLTEIISDDQNDQSFIIVLDNFNVLTKDFSVPLEFFSFLRSLANRYPVAYIISSVCPLQEMCARKEVGESPFFNIFTNIELKTFSDEEGEKLLSYHPNLSAREIIKSLSGFHPYLMQQVIELLLDESNIFNLENIKQVLTENNKQFVKDLLNYFPDQYPQLLTNLALDIKPTEKGLYIVNKLIQKGYVDSDYKIPSKIIQSILISLRRENTKGFFLKIKKWFSFRK